MSPQVAEELGDEVKVLKIDVDENPVLSSQLRVSGRGMDGGWEGWKMPHTGSGVENGRHWERGKMPDTITHRVRLSL
jgi:hypothetical protein